MTSSSLSPSRVTSRGFTLIEALVALIIFSIALLGLASLYAQSLIVTHGSYLRSLASIQASDIAERIYANPLVIIDDPDNPDYSGYEFTCDGVAAPPENCAEGACDVDELAAWDAHEWCAATEQVFGGLLVEGETRVEEDPSQPNDILITIQWQERKPESRDDAGNIGGAEIEDTTFQYRMRKP